MNFEPVLSCKQEPKISFKALSFKATQKPLISLKFYWLEEKYTSESDFLLVNIR